MIPGSSKPKEIKMKKNILTIGRSTKSDVHINDVKMSRNHAKIEVNQKGVPVLIDLGSLAGAFVNGNKVIISPLKNGDQITLGSTTFTFKGIYSFKGKIY